MAAYSKRRIWPIATAGIIIVVVLAVAAIGLVLGRSATPKRGYTTAPASVPTTVPPSAVPSAAPSPRSIPSPLPTPSAVPSGVAPTPSSTPPIPETTAPAADPDVILVPINAPLDAVSQLGDFTKSYGIDAELTPPGAQGPVSVRGDEPGWFGGTKGAKELTCDRSRLADELEADPARAAAFGSVLGVGTEGIRDLVMELTPVVLRTDTSVTIWGLADGGPESVPAVLQAGTAVLVSPRGGPTVRCFGNDPLSGSPVLIDAETLTGGTGWPAWTPSQHAVVSVAARDIRRFVLVDSATGRLFIRPSGIHGTQDRWARP